MKKIAGIMLSLLVVLMSFSACVGSDNYKYADKWDIETDFQIVNAKECVEAYAKPEASANYNDLLSSVKDTTRSTISHFEFLDWDKFEKLQSVYELDIDTSDVEAMSPEELIVFSSYIAYYDERSDSVYILPQYYETADAQKVYCLVHEVIHSLVPNRDDADDSTIVEGFVDWLALQVCSDLGLDVTASYQESILCLRMLMDIHGEENVIRAICEDRIVDLIDGSTGAGMAEKLNVALFVAHGNDSVTKEDIQEAVNVELDIISHVARQEGVDIRDWINTIARIYEANGVKIDTNYFI